jgi:excisionase family DNA binding protein
MSLAIAASLVSIPQKLFVDRREFAQLTGLSVGMVDKMLRDGRIKARRAGDRVLIPVNELLRFAEGETSEG